MANFSDLNFKAHPNLPNSTFARFNFPNGYAVSVITGEFAYTSPSSPYEVAVMLDDACCYDTPITDDVLGYQTPDAISKVMAQVEALPKPEEEPTWIL